MADDLLEEVGSLGTWSKRVRERARNRCEFRLEGCQGKATEADHVFTRTLGKCRLLLLNGLATCKSCHKIVTDDRARKRRILRAKMGAKRFDALIEFVAQHYGKLMVRDYATQEED